MALGLVSSSLVLSGPRGRTATAVALAAGAGLLLGAHARDGVLESPLRAWLAARSSPVPEHVRVEGRLTADAEPAGEGTRMMVALEAVEADGIRIPIRGRIMAHVAGSRSGRARAGWTRGRHVGLTASIREPDGFRNPGGPSEAWQDLRRPYDVLASVKSAELVEISPGGWADEWAARVRARVRRRVAASFGSHGGQTVGVIVAILIGDRSGLTPSLVRSLQVAGTYHVIAISGGNIALLTALCLVTSRLLSRSHRVSTLAALAIVLLYGWVVGGDASVDRAVIAAALYLTLSMIGLTVHALAGLLVVAAVMTAIDPLITVDAGAWLSFGASFGIISFASRLGGRFSTWPASPPRLVARLARAAFAVAAATVAAEIVLLPVTTTLFSRAGLAGLALNLIAIPAMAVVQVGSLTVLAIDMVAPTWARLLTIGPHVAVEALVRSAALANWLPGATWRVPPPSVITVLLFYGAVAALVPARLAMRWRWRAVGVATVCAAWIVVAPTLSLGRPPAGHLRLTLVDVGQGDGIVLQFPGGYALVVDAGTASATFDVGDRVMTPTLWALGERRIDWLAFTHADLDHIGGALALAQTFSPREIWEGVPVPRDPERAALVEATGRTRRVWRALRAGETITIGRAGVEVLHPPNPDWERQKVRNDDSLVLRVRFGDVEFLLTGDVGQEAERAIHGQLGSSAPIKILKVAHHGSATSTDAAFVEAYRPDLALISVGRHNAFGHPSAAVLARLAAAGARVMRTDRDGAITLETDGAGVRATSEAGRVWQGRVWRGPA